MIDPSTVPEIQEEEQQQQQQQQQSPAPVKSTA